MSTQPGPARCRMRVRRRADGLPRPRGDDADAARGPGGDDRGAGRRSATPRRCTPPGRRARRVVEESRELIAEALGARPSEVVFTSGGTEADNLAVKGLYWARRAADPGPAPGPGQRRRAPRRARRVQWLAEHEGAEVDWLPVDARGRGQPGRPCARPSSATRTTVALVSVMWANNEVGTVQPIAELAAARRRVRHPVPHRRRPGGRAAAGRLRRERRRRADRSPGTSSAARSASARCCWPGRRVQCRCCTAAARSATSAPAPSTSPAIGGVRGRRRGRGRERSAYEASGSAALRDDLIDQVLRGRPRRRRSTAPRRAGRLPGNAHFSFPGCEGDSLLMLLDAQGIECSTGSACSAGVAQPSHVLLAMGADEARARGSLRFSLGHTSDRRPTSTRSSPRSARSSSGPGGPPGRRPPPVLDG